LIAYVLTRGKESFDNKNLIIEVGMNILELDHKLKQMIKIINYVTELKTIVLTDDLHKSAAKQIINQYDKVNFKNDFVYIIILNNDKQIFDAIKKHDLENPNSKYFI
jgi:hypothetical protein